MAARAPVLWQFAISHYAEKARWALDYKQVPHLRRSLLPGPHVSRIRRMTGQTAVPVLELGGAIIFDSTRIIEAIEKAHPDPPLYPADREARERALELEDYFDEELGPYIRQWGYFMLLPYSSTVTALFTSQAGLGKRLFMRAIFPLVRPLMRSKMKVYPAEAGAARDKTVAAMDRIARDLQPSGYLVGNGFTVADLTAAALLSPLVMPKEFPYPPPTAIPAPLAQARAQLAEHPALKWAAGIYAKHRGKSAALAEETVI
ncbi:glutathione S-transferase family protein [Candidatus Binatus soli]|jgi:glutathione S-transferase|uniref:glutathione S-transferase family protein n=1 Tax=Candidatus Binatus soli TaxID=1953413 RepID=UPI003D10660A